MNSPCGTAVSPRACLGPSDLTHKLQGLNSITLTFLQLLTVCHCMASYENQLAAITSSTLSPPGSCTVHTIMPSTKTYFFIYFGHKKAHFFFCFLCFHPPPSSLPGSLSFSIGLADTSQQPNRSHYQKHRS